MSAPLRILFVNRMASMVRGGGETFDLEMARHLDALGCETTVLSGLPLVGSGRSPVAHPRKATIRTPYLGWFPWDKVRGGWRLRLADFYFFEKRAASWARAHADQFDLVQVCELPTFVSSWKARGPALPVVMRLTAPDYFDDLSAVQKADAVIASGTSIAKLREGPRPDCFDVPNGVDTTLFRPQETDARQRMGLSRDDIVVLCVARFQSVKNHAMLLRAFRYMTEQVPNARLVLVGSGPLGQSVKAQCERLKLTREQVLFRGEVPFHDLPVIYAAADLGVIPSDYESFCFAALEGMASGLPLVVTDTDWVPRLIEHGKGGCVVPVGAAKAFGSALVELARDPERRHRMGAFNREKAVSQYSWHSSARKLLDIYTKLVPDRACQGGG